LPLPLDAQGIDGGPCWSDKLCGDDSRRSLARLAKRLDHL
jgi:hypothetical protein